MAAKKNRLKLFKKQRGKCFYCGKDVKLNANVNDPRLMTIDHVVPRAQLHKFTNGFLPDNHVAACLECNQRKANKSKSEFIKELEKP